MYQNANDERNSGVYNKVIQNTSVWQNTMFMPLVRQPFLYDRGIDHPVPIPRDATPSFASGKALPNREGSEPKNIRTHTFTALAFMLVGAIRIHFVGVKHACEVLAHPAIAKGNHRRRLQGRTYTPPICYIEK